MRPGWIYLLLIACFSSLAWGQTAIEPPSLSTSGNGKHAGSFSVADQRKVAEPIDVVKSKDDAEIHMALGKLLFIASDGAHYCTAELVDTDVILTAAHCAILGKYKDFQFQPDGSTAAPYDFQCISTNTNWVDPTNTSVTDPYINVRFDYAFIKLKTAPAGMRALAVDYDNRWPVHKNSFEAGNNKVLGLHSRVVGYPADESAPPGSVAYTLPAILMLEPYHPNIDAVATRTTTFGRGVSGGAWIVNENSVLTIVSINSSISNAAANNNDTPTTTKNRMGSPLKVNLAPYVTLYGPILDDDARQLEDNAARRNCQFPP